MTSFLILHRDLGTNVAEAESHREDRKREVRCGFQLIKKLCNFETPLEIKQICV